MLIPELRMRVAWQASHFMDSVRDRTMRDFDDDIDLLHKGVLTVDNIAKTWAAYIGKEYTGGSQNGTE